jgi:hypothetical protein
MSSSFHGMQTQALTTANRTYQGRSSSNMDALTVSGLVERKPGADLYTVQDESVQVERPGDEVRAHHHHDWSALEVDATTIPAQSSSFSAQGLRLGYEHANPEKLNTKFNLVVLTIAAALPAAV